MGFSKIEWTERTWNPIIGCTKVSPGCTNCYAEKMAKRQIHIGMMRSQFSRNIADTFYDYSAVINLDSEGWNGEVVFRQNQISKPLHWRKPCMIFVCSMSDLFQEGIRDEWICNVFEIIEQCPQHTFQILTKRPGRAVQWFNEYKGFNFSNVWFGVTAENQATEDARVPKLADVSTAVRFASIEPMLEPIDLVLEHSKIYLDWVIVGCESGPKRRPCKIEWIQSIVRQCEKAGVLCFVKAIHDEKGRVVKDMNKFPPDLRVRQIPEVNVA